MAKHVDYNLKDITKLVDERG